MIIRRLTRHAATLEQVEALRKIYGPDFVIEEVSASLPTEPSEAVIAFDSLVLGADVAEVVLPTEIMASVMRYSLFVISGHPVIRSRMRRTLVGGEATFSFDAYEEITEVVYKTRPPRKSKISFLNRVEGYRAASSSREVDDDSALKAMGIEAAKAVLALPRHGELACIMASMADGVDIPALIMSADPQYIECVRGEKQFQENARYLLKLARDRNEEAECFLRKERNGNTTKNTGI